MKTILRVLSGAGIAAAVMVMAITDVKADDHYANRGNAHRYSRDDSYRGNSRGYPGRWNNNHDRSNWNLGFSFIFSPPPVYYSPPPPVYYSPPPAAVVYSQPVQPPPPPVEQVQPMGVADVKALARSGVSEEVIISQIRSSRVVYHLTTAEIIDLSESGVSQKVIDFMINTAGS